jgi:glycosyltransferase involved in cell wall biosynthesis
VAGEALASGATLVASNVDNLREMFFHADLSFEIEDLNDFVRALQIGLKLDRSDAIRISLKRIQNLNNLESVALRYLEYFQS